MPGVFFLCRYHGDSNIPAMMAIVVPLHEELERGAITAKEQTFQVIYVMFVSRGLCLSAERRVGWLFEGSWHFQVCMMFCGRGLRFALLRVPLPFPSCPVLSAVSAGVVLSDACCLRLSGRPPSLCLCVPIDMVCFFFSWPSVSCVTVCLSYAYYLRRIHRMVGGGYIDDGLQQLRPRVRVFFFGFSWEVRRASFHVVALV